jgi:hypothetical protein
MESTMLDQEVRSHALSLLSGDLTLAEFEDWFVAAGWDERTELVAKIDHLLAEKDLISGAEFNEELSQYLSTVWIKRARPFHFMFSNTVVPSEPMIFGSDVTIRRHLEFAGS